MGEIKGQLLTVLLVVVVFAAIGGALYATFTGTKDKIVTKINELDVTKSSQNDKLIEFKE